MIEKVSFSSEIPAMVSSFKNRKGLIIVIVVLVGVFFAILAAFFLKKCCPRFWNRENDRGVSVPLVTRTD